MIESTKNNRVRPAGQWPVALVCLALAAMTLAVFGRTLNHPFVNYDDGDYVYANPLVLQGLNWQGIGWAFTHAECSLYHPLTMLSLMTDYQLYGLHAGGYHLTNLLLHTASVILLFLVLRAMTGTFWRSAFVAAVFAIHPLRVESVAWVAERKDVLSAFFFMLTLGAYVHYGRQPNSWPRYFLVAAALVMALLSKPTVVTLPFLLLLLDYWPLQRKEKPVRLLLEKIPLLILAAAACLATVLSAQKDLAARAGVTVSTHIANAFVSYALYLRQMIWPAKLAVFYPQLEKGQPLWIVAGCFLLLASITVMVWIFREQRRWLLTSWFWYLGMLTPMIGVVQAGAFAHADRMTYLPQIGIYMALAWLVAEWQPCRLAVGSVGAMALAALMLCAWRQTGYWQNSETLWNHALACTVDNYVAQSNLGNALRDQGKLNEAMDHYQTALALNPAYAPAHYNLGNAFFGEGKMDEAIKSYRAALQLDPNYVEAHYNLGTALYNEGRLDEAILHFWQALHLQPRYEEAQNNLGLALLQKGNLDEAISHFQAALQIKPGAPSPWSNLGVTLLRKGDAQAAISYFQKALELRPDYIDARVNLGDAFLQTGQVAEAAGEYVAALKLNPNNAEIRQKLSQANAVLQSGKK